MCPFEFESSNGKWRILRLCGTITFRLSVELGLYIGEDIYVSAKRGGCGVPRLLGAKARLQKKKLKKKIEEFRFPSRDIEYSGWNPE